MSSGNQSEVLVNGENIVKAFGGFKALNGFSVHIKKGECFGLLGPNGAGKSTFISLLYGTALRTSGDLKVFGFDPATHSREIKMKLGVVTQDNALDESLTVIENLQLYAGFMGIPKSQRTQRIMSLLEYMNLQHKAQAKIQTLSGGMKRRLVFVRALLNEPELLILDEPTTGLDPAVRHLLWGKVRELQEKGTTILLTTHYMHEAEVLCDRLVILDQGQVKAEGSPQKLIEEFGDGYVAIFSFDQIEKIKGLIASHKEFSWVEDDTGLYVKSAQLETLLEFSKAQKLKTAQIRPANLEDVFLKCIGRELNQDA